MKRILVIIIVIVLLIVLRSAILSIQQLHNSRDRLTSLKLELSDTKNENAFLKERLKYVQTNDFIESEARNKLGLVGADEYVIIAPPPPIENTGIIDPNMSNWKKWLRLFI